MVFRVNFKKNEKTYNAANSEVLKMVQEIDKEPRDQEPGNVIISFYKFKRNFDCRNDEFGEGG